MGESTQTKTHSLNCPDEFVKRLDGVKEKEINIRIVQLISLLKRSPCMQYINIDLIVQSNTWSTPFVKSS